MAKPVLRQSQLLSTFGPGAMLDLPDRSVLISGLDDWVWNKKASKQIEEPRLIQLLERRLKSDGRLPDDAVLSLRTPPAANTMDSDDRAAVQARVFPKWFLCEVEPDMMPLGDGTHSGLREQRRRRRMVTWDQLDNRTKRFFQREDGAKLNVTPIRFVGACPKGHLQDLTWRGLVHEQGFKCRETMWLEDRGTSSDARDTRIVCDCGAELTLDKLFARGRLGFCHGKRPWLDEDEPNGCTERLKLLTRTATNTYFSQVATIISIPEDEDELSRIIDRYYSSLRELQTVAEIDAVRKFDKAFANEVKGYDSQNILNRLNDIHSKVKPADNIKDPKREEFELFASGRAKIGENQRGARLHAETLDRSWWQEDLDHISNKIANVVVVHRLREVSCQYGFTRFEPAATDTDEQLEDVRLAVEGAPLTTEQTWLPALEQFGEGVFLHFDRDAVRSWQNQKATQQRADQLRRGFEHWKRFHPEGEGMRRSVVYTMLHSLSHALMAEIALEAGYPVSALKERIYALQSEGKHGPVDNCGILIYTAAPGSQGTLGGLVDASRGLHRLLRQALDRLELCSGDPICADHEPRSSNDDRALHGAACHACLLIAEPSCENRNLFLDRSLLVETLGEHAAPFVER